MIYIVYIFLKSIEHIIRFGTAVKTVFVGVVLSVPLIEPQKEVVKVSEASTEALVADETPVLTEAAIEKVTSTI